MDKILEYIESLIAVEKYFNTGKTTICLLILKSGFEVIGTSGIVDKKMFDLEIGKKIARESAIRKMFEFEGYALQVGVIIENNSPKNALADIDLSDGYHTYHELYEFRKHYNATLFNEWAKQGKYEVHKSWKHQDGEYCFGGGWFIVVAILPTGQISNHYKKEDWKLFNCIELEKAKYEFDGHTGKDVIDRLANLVEHKNDLSKLSLSTFSSDAVHIFQTAFSHIRRNTKNIAYRKSWNKLQFLMCAKEDDQEGNWIVLVNSDPSPYVPTQEDLFATDWIIEQ